MSRLRWSLAGVLAVIAAVASVQALLTYVEHRVTVGVIAVLALAATLVVGLVSLAQARRRIDRELGGLRARPPSGDLYQERRRRLEAIKAAGARPDADALAERTAAEEAGRAYFGRYLVATTVLIGLVGTFAGLMETIGKVSPLLSESGGGGLSLLAAPLAGLHVTFGASLVAILATLSLALAQGDLALHEELALASLHDLTTHELIPQLWPADREGSGVERTVAAINELRQTFGDALVRSLEKGAGRLAAETRSESERAAKALELAAAAVEKQITRLCETVGAGLADSGRRQSAALSETAAKQHESLSKSAASVAETLAKSAAAQGQALDALRTELERAITRAGQAHGQTLEAATTAVAARLGEAATGTLAALRTELETAIARTTGAADKAVVELARTASDAITHAASSAESASSTAAQAAVEAAQKAADAAATAAERAAAAASEASERAVSAATEVGERAVSAAIAASERAVNAATQASERAAVAASEASERAVTAASEASERAAAAAGEASERAVNAASEASARGVSLGEEAVRALGERLAGSVEPLLAAEAGRLEEVRTTLASIAERLDAVGARLDEVAGGLGELGRGHVSALEETGRSVIASFDKAVLGGGAALDAAAGIVAAAAKDLRAGTEGFAPTLGQLAKEIGDLGREVALMAARAPENDSQLVLHAELDRLGTGMERLTALVEMASGATPVSRATTDGESAVATVLESPADSAGENAAETAASESAAASDESPEESADVPTPAAELADATAVTIAEDGAAPEMAETTAPVETAETSETAGPTAAEAAEAAELATGLAADDGFATVSTTMEIDVAGQPVEAPAPEAAPRKGKRGRAKGKPRTARVAPVDDGIVAAPIVDVTGEYAVKPRDEAAASDDDTTPGRDVDAEVVAAIDAEAHGDVGFEIESLDEEPGEELTSIDEMADELDLGELPLKEEKG